MNETQGAKKSWYEKNYKLLLIIPAVLLIFSAVYLFQFNAQNGDLVLKDVSLTGGTTITVLDTDTSVDALKEALSEQFPDILVREISDIRTRKQQAFFVETASDVEEIRPALENFLGYGLTQENSSIEFSGSSLSSGIYDQLRTAMLIAFVFMAIVVFLIFRTPIPALAVIISALADIILTIVVVNLAGIALSIGGIVALLMLVGYSVDTDILLTTRLLRKREGTLNQRTKGAFKTGMTMIITSMIAIGAALAIIYSFSETLRQIFTILLIGLGIDIFNTWITNASILRWYMEVKKIE